jgi:hypothetical protein
MVALYLRRSILETSLGDETILGSVDGREVLLYRLGKAAWDPGIIPTRRFIACAHDPLQVLV